MKRHRDRALSVLCTCCLFSALSFATENNPKRPPILPIKVEANEKLSLNFQNIDVRDAIVALAEFSGLNIVMSDAVIGHISLRLTQVSWQQALDLLMQMSRLEARKTGNIVQIATQEEWLKHDKHLFEAAHQRRSWGESGAETFALRYRQIDDVKKLLENGRILSERGRLLTDTQTNILSIDDTPTTRQTVRDFLQWIDVPIKQVMIEAQIVEASDNFSRDLGMKLDSVKIRNPSHPIPPPPPPPPHRSSRAPWPGKTPPLPQGELSLPININLPIAHPYATIGALFKASASTLIHLELQAMQAEDRGKVISSPRLLVADRTEALIEEGSEIPYTYATKRDTIATAFKKAVLSLRVKPHISPENTIWLDIDINKDSPNFRQHVGGAPTVDTKHVKTQVKIEDGGTVVIGGIYIDEYSLVENKVPFLSDVPVLGLLFQSSQTKKNRRELLVFITPTIVTNE